MSSIPAALLPQNPTFSGHETFALRSNWLKKAYDILRYTPDLYHKRSLMTTIDDIKVAITQLSPEALHELRAWYEQFDAQRWDEQMMTDIAAGRFDQFAEEAIRAFQSGETTEV